MVPWIYGTDRLINDIEAMLGKKPDWLWKICIISWKYISPLVLIVIHLDLIFFRKILILCKMFFTFKLVIISTFIIPASELNLRGIPYPFYSKIIGWIIALIPISAIIILAITQSIKYKFNWVIFITLK